MPNAAGLRAPLVPRPGLPKTSLLPGKAAQRFIIEDRRTLERLLKSRGVITQREPLFRQKPAGSRAATPDTQFSDHSPANLVRVERSDHRSNVIRYSRTPQRGHSGDRSVDFEMMSTPRRERLRAVVWRRPRLPPVMMTGLVRQGLLTLVSLRVKRGVESISAPE